MHNRLREERKRLELSQARMADLCGVSLVSQQNYEKGVRKPDSAYMEALASAGADVFYILTGGRAGTQAGRLQNERCRLGYGIKEFADVGEVSTEEQRAFESDETLHLPAAYLNCISAIGAEIFWIVRGLPEDDDLREKQALPYRPEDRDLIEDYKLSPPPVQDSVRAILKNAADAKREQVKQWKEAQEIAQKTQPKTPNTEQK